MQKILGTVTVSSPTRTEVLYIVLDKRKKVRARADIDIIIFEFVTLVVYF